VLQILKKWQWNYTAASVQIAHLSAGDQPEIFRQKILYLSFMEQKRKSASKIKAVRGRVYFIGSGPGDPELVTIKARNIIVKADLIIYAGSLVNQRYFQEQKKNVRILDSASMTLEEVAA